MKDGIMDAVKRAFRPEFINRIDDIVVFKPLEKEELLKITEVMLQDVIKRAADQALDLSVEQDACQLLLDKGFDPKYGARPLRRTIQRMVEDKLADMILEGTLSPGDHIKLTTCLKPPTEGVETPAGSDEKPSELCFDKMCKPEEETISR